MVAAGKIPVSTEDLNLTTTSSTKEVTLQPGESKTVILSISIPNDWPRCMVGEKILYEAHFEPIGNPTVADLSVLSDSASFQINLVG